ncbi:hypothetical protein ACNQ6O_14485, partial [Marinobacter sp. SBS5]|uniref:hypothetical protein n=1 Tax=Marinobacter sp. SBS5 TaxID=3401754 RepID=UPI003AB0E274
IHKSPSQLFQFKVLSGNPNTWGSLWEESFPEICGAMDGGAEAPKDGLSVFCTAAPAMRHDQGPKARGDPSLRSDFVVKL